MGIEDKEGNVFALTDENGNPVQMNLETGEAEELTAEDQIADLLEEIKIQDNIIRREIKTTISYLRTQGWQFVKEDDESYTIVGKQGFDKIQYKIGKEKMNMEAFRDFLKTLLAKA